MALSFSHQVMLSVSLALCACVLIPRMFGGRGDTKTKPDPRIMAPANARPYRETHGKDHKHTVGPEGMAYTNIDQIKKAMEKDLKAEKANGNGRSLAFTLMPLYAVGVAIFAAYKFTKIKTNEKSQSNKETDKKSKETESQLLQLEHHLSQTEHMLNSLLTQLDPLSNCVNTLASGQRDEIMNQLQSIRLLMKESGIEKTSLTKQTCEDTLEELIYSFKEQDSDRIDDYEEEREEQSDDPQAQAVHHEDFSAHLHLNFQDVQPNEELDVDLTLNKITSVLRKRLLETLMCTAKGKVFIPYTSPDYNNTPICIGASWLSAITRQKSSWDSSLAKIAKAWTSLCMEKHNIYLQTETVHPYFLPIGENIFLGGVFNIRQVVKIWASEVNDYDSNQQTCHAGKACGHYTQVRCSYNLF
ncbi:glioma pathogenesis-related protein 1 [Pelodytes ibericus]